MKKKLELLESEIDSIKILINELPTQTQEVKVGDASGVIPFEKEFGVQGNYLRIFGRTGYLIKDGKMNEYNYGTGRRKSSVARVFMKKGTGQFIVNGLPLEQYLTRETDCMVVKQPLELTNNTDGFDFKPVEPPSLKRGFEEVHQEV